MIIDKLINKDLTPSEAIARDYILKQKHNIYDKTLAQCEKECYISAPTFIRLAKKMGFDGWIDFRGALTKEFSYYQEENQPINANIPFNETDTVETIISNVTQLKISALKEVQQFIDIESIKEISSKIEQSQLIIIYANSINKFLLEDFSMKMRRLGYNVIVSHIGNEQLHDAYNMNKNDTAIFASFSGSFDRLETLIRILKNRNVCIVSITNSNGNYLSKHSNYHIRLSPREHLYLKIANFTSNASIMHIMDLIYSVIFANNYKDNIEHLSYIEPNFTRRGK